MDFGGIPVQKASPTEEELLELTSQERQVWFFINGRTTINEIVYHLNIQDYLVEDILRKFIEKKWIEFKLTGMLAALDNYLQERLRKKGKSEK